MAREPSAAGHSRVSSSAWPQAGAELLVTPAAHHDLPAALPVLEGCKLMKGTEEQEEHFCFLIVVSSSKTPHRLAQG